MPHRIPCRRVAGSGFQRNHLRVYSESLMENFLNPDENTLHLPSSSTESDVDDLTPQSLLPHQQQRSVQLFPSMPGNRGIGRPMPPHRESPNVGSECD